MNSLAAEGDSDCGGSILRVLGSINGSFSETSEFVVDSDDDNNEEENTCFALAAVAVAVGLAGRKAEPQQRTRLDAGAKCALVLFWRNNIAERIVMSMCSFCRPTC